MNLFNLWTYCQGAGLRAKHNVMSHCHLLIQSRAQSRSFRPWWDHHYVSLDRIPVWGSNALQRNVVRAKDLYPYILWMCFCLLIVTVEEPQNFIELNDQQRSIVMFYRDWCKKAVIALKEGKPVEPYHVFLSGPGGVGKSHVIKLIHSDTLKLLKLSGTFEPDDVTVLLTSTETQQVQTCPFQPLS